MKTCPVCGETYSERIDFCFNEGAVLSLQPSAMDAPVPRMAAAAAAASGPQGLANGAAPGPAATKAKPKPPKAPKAPKTPAAPEPAPATDLPPAARELDQDAVETQTEMAAVATTVVDDDPAVGFGDLPDDVGEEEERRAGVVWWFVGAAAIALAITVFGVVLTTGDEAATARAPTPTFVEPVADRVPATAAVEEPDEPEEEPVAVVEPPEAEPEPVAEPDPEPEPVRAAPARVAPTSSKPALAASVRPRSEPIRPPLPQAEEPPRVSAPPTRTAAASQPAAPAAGGASPWDQAAPTEATVRLLSDPPGALVRVDGKLRGKTPLDVMLPYGAHEVELSLDNYKPLKRSIEVASDKPKFPHVLEPAVRQGNVHVVAPGLEGALLLVDGVAQGSLPREVLLTEGGHIFEVRSPNAPPQRVRKVVSLAAQGVTRLELTF
ncbi:MAG: PEGA domain-containing protein [Alphaproteobacteria bacterium]|nr:PEGA domain-containing protein [Alphaproteobacteria bacterium]